MFFKKLHKLFLAFALILFFSRINAQEVRVIDNKGTIKKVNNNRVFSQNDDPNTPTIISVENDVWHDTDDAIFYIWDVVEATGIGSWKAINNPEHTGTTGSVFFADINGTPTENNNQFFWDNTDNKLGIGNNNPTERLDVNGKLRIRDVATVTTNNDILTVTATGVVEKKDASTYESVWLGKDDNLSADKNDTEIYKDGKVGIGDFSASTLDAELHVKNNNNVPFKIEPNTTTPAGSSGGQMYVDSTDGILYIYDATRNKWLSVDRTNVLFGYINNIGGGQGGYLRQINGVNSGLVGWKIMRNATITGLSAQTRESKTWTLTIRRKNTGLSDIISLDINGTDGAVNNMANINLNQGDIISAYCDNREIGDSNNVRDPEVIIEIAWRK